MKNILKNKLIVITGFGRSGTTILGKILGSMQPSVYCFEPPIMKYLSEFGLTDVPAKILFETHFLQEFQGRGNMNELDWSCSCHYVPPITIDARRRFIARRSNAVEILEEDDYKFILKGTELQHQFELINGLFPGFRFIHIIRNGLASVASAISRGWYTDDYCNSSVVESMMPHFKCDIPYFIDSDCYISWPDWNPETRAACAWRSAVTDGVRYKHDNPDRCVQFRYEDFRARPGLYAEYLGKKFKLRIMPLTKDHIGAIDSFRSLKILSGFKDHTRSILEPERSKFLKLNQMLYET